LIGSFYQELVEMKSRLLRACLCGLLVLGFVAPSVVWAQQQAKEDKGQTTPKKHKHKGKAEAKSSAKNEASSSPKPDLTTKQGLQQLDQILTKRLGLDDQQREKIRTLSQNYAKALSRSIQETATLKQQEYGKKLKELQAKAKQAKQDKDENAIKALKQQLTELKAKFSKDGPDASQLVADITKALTEEQAAEFKKLAQELNLNPAASVGQKLSPKDYVAAIMSKRVGLSGKVKKDIVNIYKKAAKDLKNARKEKNEDKANQIAAKMRADIKAKLSSEQWKKAEESLLHAEKQHQQELSAQKKAEKTDQGDDGSAKKGKSKGKAKTDKHGGK